MKNAKVGSNAGILIQLFGTAVLPGCTLPRTSRVSRHDFMNYKNLTYRFRSIGTFFICLCVVVFSAGCGNSPYPAANSSRSILYLALTDDVKTLDPTIAYDVDSGSIVNLLYSSYFKYDYLKRNPLQLDLCLGARMPIVKKVRYLAAMPDGSKKMVDGQLWTFQIRSDLHFQNDPCFPHGQGRQITAADFIYSFKRMADPSVPCPIVAYFDTKIEGMAAYEAHNRKLINEHKKPDYSYPIAGLQLDRRNPYIFRILLNHPYPQLRYLMAMSFTAPLAHEAVEMYGAHLATHPVGCGQYVLAKYVPRGEIVLKTNPNRPVEFYPNTGMPGDRAAGLLVDAGKQLPLVNTVQFNIIREGITAWNEFRQGYLDATGVSQNNFQQAMPRPDYLSPDLAARGIRLVKSVGIDVDYYIFNMDDPVVGGYSARARHLRQAISLAIDEREEIDLETLGLGTPAQWLVPPGLFGYDPHYVNPYRVFNLQRAKALLAEAGYPNGIDPTTHKRLVIYYDNSYTDAAGRQALALHVRELDALGIDVVARSYRYNVFQDHVNNGQFQFANWGWVADYPDPENFAFLLYGPNKRPGPNESDYNNPEYNRIFAEMQTMNDTPARAHLIAELRDISVRDCPLVYQRHSEAYALVQPWLKNYKPNPIALDSPEYYRIDGVLRAKLQHRWNKPKVWPLVLVLTLLIASAVPALNVVKQRANRHVRRSKPGGNAGS